jgi:hypothetical protein
MEFDAQYKNFIKYKIFHFNIFQKIRSLEDLRYTLGLIWFAKKIVFKHCVDNETIRGR